MKQMLREAIRKGQKSLSEHDSRTVIESAGVSLSRGKLVNTRAEAVSVAREIGFPVVLKGCGHELTHKTELGAVRLKLRDREEVSEAYDEITGINAQMDGVLVQEWISGDGREFVMGLTRDQQFGPCVMFGLGGIFTEALNDVSFRVAPLTVYDAEEMINEIRTRKLLDEFRGSPAVDREVLVKSLIGLGELGTGYDEIKEIDINPVIISGTVPVAVDALVVLETGNGLGVNA